MIFNLFKSELNFKEHPDILNYLIVEEAEQQWNYHLKEGLTKEAFRSPQFSSSVVNLFVQKILKMRIDEKLLLLIADFGFRRVKEIIDEYTELEKNGIEAINFENRKKNYEIVCQMNRDLQLSVKELNSRFNNNSKLMNEFIEKGSVEFNKLDKAKRNKPAEDLKKEILSIINTRNKNNLF
jgi:hypothetical protein